MIVRNEGYRSLECTVCGELVELSGRTYGNPELQLLILEQMTLEHKRCPRWKHDPRRARLEREFDRRWAER